MQPRVDGDAARETLRLRTGRGVIAAVGTVGVGEERQRISALGKTGDRARSS